MPRIGVVGMAFPGFNLKEEMCPEKLQQMLKTLDEQPFEVLTASKPVYSNTDAREAGFELNNKEVDCVLAVITTFVPDYFIVELLSRCDKPVFLWAVEREIECIALVCGPMITATLYNLNKNYCLYGSDIGDRDTINELAIFARAAMLKRLLSKTRIGYMGGKPDIMFSMTVDEYQLKRVLDTSIINIPIEELYETVKHISDVDGEKCWTDVKSKAGNVSVGCNDGIESCKFLLATSKLVEKYEIDAISINCFPHLKSKICLTIARLNDNLIASACEGDLHSTILMYLLSSLTNKSAFNGDFLRINSDENTVLFSHCGAGAFNLAESPSSVGLQNSIETCDGLAVCYATRMDGEVTLLNMMLGPDGMRIASMLGEAKETDLTYEGTPLLVGFEHDVKQLLQRVSKCGAGHHWNGINGNYIKEFALLCNFLNVKFNYLTK